MQMQTTLPTIPLCYTHSLTGLRETNEDLIVTGEYQVGDDVVYYYLVCDGHGGVSVASLVSECLVRLISSERPPLEGPRIQSIYRELHREVALLPESYTSGAAHILALVYQNCLQVINLGDCRAVAQYSTAHHLSDCTTTLSRDHKPQLPLERARLHRLAQSRGINPDLYHSGVWRVGEGLSLSRCSGDLDSQPWVHHLPTWSTSSLSDYQCIILACDGLWDVVSTETALSLATDIIQLDSWKIWGPPPESGCPAERLARYALDEGSDDNVSVIILYLEQTVNGSGDL